MRMRGALPISSCSTGAVRMGSSPSVTPRRLALRRCPSSRAISPTIWPIPRAGNIVSTPPTTSFGRRHWCTQPLVRREHAVVARELDVRRRHQCCQPAHKVQRLEHDLRGAVTVRGLQAVRSIPLRAQRQPFNRDRRARDVAVVEACAVAADAAATWSGLRHAQQGEHIEQACKQCRAEKHADRQR